MGGGEANQAATAGNGAPHRGGRAVARRFTMHVGDLDVETIELETERGIAARVIAYGATLAALRTPDRDGMIDDIVLGHDTIAPYIERPGYFGSTIGRYANRIARGRITVSGRSHALACNDGANHLHGGRCGFDRRPWTVVTASGGDAASVTLALTSPDGEEGYPGTLAATATYTLDDEALTIDYRATTSAPTVVNMTNHSFFNLAGRRARRSAMAHRLTIDAQSFTPVDDALIPTGERRSVAGGPFDFRVATPIGSRIGDADVQLQAGRGYDHNFVVDGDPGTLRRAARLEDPASGRVLEVMQTAPGLQFYSGNFLDGSVLGKGARLYRQGDGVALEPQSFPDSPNHRDFPSASLDPGETYRTTIVYRWSVLAPVRAE